MIRLAVPLAVIAALVLLGSRQARGLVRRDPVACLIHGAALVFLLLAITGRINPLIAAGWLGLSLLWVLVAWLGPRLIGRGHYDTLAGDTDGEADGSPDDGRDGRMSLREARETLGVGPEAGREAIAAAHRRLMQRAHPDRGGSAGLAQRLNEARAVLLGDHSEDDTS